MLKPNSNRDLVPINQPSSIIKAAESIAWNPLTPVEDLPRALAQLRETQRQVNRLVQDAEAQVVQLLRRGPFAKHVAFISECIQRFYPFTEALLEEISGYVDHSFLKFNPQLAYHIGKPLGASFKLDWNEICAKANLDNRFVKRFKDSIVWTYLVDNRYFKWNPASINLCLDNMDDDFGDLVSNWGVPWSEELIREFSDYLDYALDGDFMKNEGLPWEDTKLPKLLLELGAKQAALTADDIDKVAESMRRRSWDRRSQNHRLDWQAADLREHRDDWNWQRLSANPALPFSVDLIEEFSDYWEWTKLAANFGFYDKVMAPYLSDNVVKEFLLLSSL
jgi:hypothetical protein